MSTRIGSLMRSRRCSGRKLRVLGAAAACACVAAACSSSATPSSTAKGSSSSLTHVKLAFPFYGAGDVPFFLAQDKGYFRQEGLDVTFTTVTSNVALQAATSGSIQLAYTTTIRPVKTLATGEKFYAFMPVNVGFTDDVIMSKSAYQAAGLSSSSTLKQIMTALIDKPVGIISAGGENQEVWDYLFHLAGLPQSDVHTVALGSPDANLAALKRGSIVATNLGGTSPAQAVAAGYATYLTRLSENQVPSMNKVVSDVVVATTDYAQQNPKVLTGFVAAYKKALADAYSSPQASAEQVYKDYPSAFASIAHGEFMDEYNLLISTKQLDQSLTMSPDQLDTLGTFFASTGASIPSNWKDVFQRP
jgi:NitT/TauT family transport system substrate-binding protein